MEHSFNKLPFLEILIKTKMVRLSQTFTTNPQIRNNTYISKVITPKLPKPIPYSLARRICTIITYKTPRKNLEELRATLLQRGYPTTLINKGFELALKFH